MEKLSFSKAHILALEGKRFAQKSPANPGKIVKRQGILHLRIDRHKNQRLRQQRLACMLRQIERFADEALRMRTANEDEEEK